MATNLPASVDGTPRRSRLPLSTRANATYPSQTTSPKITLPKTTSPNTTSPKIVRRKSSFVRSRADSSEGLPSPHDSIYEADYFSMSDDSTQLESWPMKTLPDRSPSATMASQERKENISLSPTTKTQAEDDSIIYGRGTVLDTITEANTSVATIQTVARPKSMDDLHNFSSHSIPERSASLRQSLRRQRSLSVNDSTFFSTSYHEVIANIERATRTPLEIHEIYAEPKTPIQAPPERPATPPGMPSWTAHQTPPSLNRPAIANHMSRFQRFLGLYPTRTTSPSTITNPYAIHRPRSAPLGRPYPRFRPTRSVYGGLAQHPFNRAPIAKAGQCANLPSALRPATPVRASSSRVASSQTPGREVRFTPSTAAQSDELHLPQDSNDVPITPLRNIAASARPMAPLIITPPTPPEQGQCSHHTREETVLPDSTTPRCTGNQYIRALPYTLPTLSFEPLMSPPPLHSPSQGRSRQNDPDVDSSEFDLDFGHPLTPTSQLMSGKLMDPSPFPSPQVSPTQHQHLMEQFPLPPCDHPSSHPPIEPQPPRKCWRCRVSNLTEISLDMAAKVLKETRNVFCLVCCGYDCDDTSTVRGSAFGSSARLVASPARTATSAPFYNSSWQDIHGVGVSSTVRRDALNATPVIF